MSRQAARTAPACPHCGAEARPVLTPANIARFGAILLGIWLLTNFPVRLRMRCPACGHRFAFDSVTHAPVEQPDRICRGCHYDLSTLGMDVAHCPECGLRRGLGPPV